MSSAESPNTEGSSASSTEGRTASRVRELLGQVLNVPASTIGPGVSAGTAAEWTSLNHLMLISQVENEFGIFFASGDVATLDSYERIVEAVVRHLRPKA